MLNFNYIIIYIITFLNASSSKSHKKILGIFFITYLFIYQTIFIKIYMNAHQCWHFEDGTISFYKVRPQRSLNIMNTNIMKKQIFHKITYDIKGYWFKGLWDYFFFGTFIYEPILMKICMNTNIMKTQIFP